MDPLKSLEIQTSAPAAKALDKQFVFVIGSPRSGTTWLVRMLAAHPAIASIPYELTLFNRFFQPWLTQYDFEADMLEQGKWTKGMAVLFDRKEFHELVQDFAERVYGRVLAQNPGATHILDKNPHYSNHLTVIERLLPGSRYIHIIRDGREVAVSMMSAKRRIGFGAEHIKNAATDWYNCVTRARAQGADIGPDRYLELRYEDLRSDPVAGLKKAFDHFSLEADPTEMERVAEEFHISRNQVSKGDPSLNVLREKNGTIWKEQLTLEQRYLFDRYAGHLLKELGYAKGSWWALNSGEQARMAFYPLVQRLRYTLRSLLHIWATPVVKKLN